MEEKSIPHYINDPVINKLNAPENKLYRPKIHFFKDAIIVLGTMVCTMLLAGIFETTLSKAGAISFEKNSRLQIFVSVYWRTQLIVLLLTLRYVLIWFVRVYQCYAKSETRLRCCFTPSCSEYTILALKKYGAIIGGIKSIRRLLRCGPPGGIDYP